MSPQTPAQPSRGRPPRVALSEQTIIEAGLTLLRREGLEAVTMRRLAAELGTGAASLYGYMSGRDELCQAMLEHLARSVPREEPDPARWREQVHDLLESLRAALVAHPGLAREALAYAPIDEETLLLGENLLGLLRAGQVRDADAAWAGDALLLITRAWALSGRQLTDDEEGPAAAAETFAWLPPQRFPHTTALAAVAASGDAAQRFRRVVDTLLDGLPAAAQRPGTEL